MPDLLALKEQECIYELRILKQEDFKDLYVAEWSNALCEKRKHLDVLPEYRRRGVASALTGKLALEILERGKVPFYCCAWSNIKSARNAIKSGFRPAWVELTVKSRKFVDGMNGI